MEWKTSLAAFLAILAGTCVIPFVTMNWDNTKVPEPPKAEIQVVSTNSLQSTNLVDRAAKPQQNVDWFKDSSKYIWDDWKIK